MDDQERGDTPKARPEAFGDWRISERFDGRTSWVLAKGDAEIEIRDEALAIEFDGEDFSFALFPPVKAVGRLMELDRGVEPPSSARDALLELRGELNAPRSTDSPLILGMALAVQILDRHIARLKP